MEANTDDTDPREDWQNRQRLMGEYNPDTWDPEPQTDTSAGEVNIIDPVLGEPVNVPGHPYDRPADMDRDHARRLALRGQFDDLDDDQPLPLLASKMRTDPVEGTQGSYSEVVRLDEPCPACGQEYGVHYCASTLGGVHGEVCLTCDHELVQP